MSAGFMDFKKNSSFYLFLQKEMILEMFLERSVIKLSIGLKSPFSPLAKICAKYLAQLDNKESDYLGESAKFLIMASKKSYNNESESLAYLLGSIFFKFISAA